MYKLGRKKRYIKKHFLRAIIIVILSVMLVLIGLIYLYKSTNKDTKITSIVERNKVFDPAKSNNNLKVNTDYYTLELPNDWKQISANKDPKYNSIEWEWQSQMRNRALEIYVDRYPTNKALNKITPVSVINNSLIPDPVSENCSTFTTKVSDTNLKVLSKWHDVTFLCDLDNIIDNVIGVGTTTDGEEISLTGRLKGPHNYMFLYTDRSVPENHNALNTALKSFTVK